MARRKRVDLSQLRREDAQVDGLRDDMMMQGQAHKRTQRPRRVETLALSLILPDRFQPRPLLPSWIRNRFFAGELSPYEAAREWLDAAGEDAGIQERVTTLVQMGNSFTSHGQIKPLTGSWQEVDGQRFFLIETGERRYWAAALLAVQSENPEEPTLQVIAVAEPARERQVIENQHAEPPTAVGRAREIAALLLDAAGVMPSGVYEDDYDYFREALGRRHKMATWKHLEPIMGVTRPYMSRLLKVLQLPTHLLELADSYQVPERVLREILDLPESDREAVLLQIIAVGGTHEDVLRLSGVDKREKSTQKKQENITQKVARRLKSAFRALDKNLPHEGSVSALASHLVVEMGDQDALQAAALMEELARQVRVRLD